MMMAFGMFVFSISTAAYQELSRSTQWRHASNSRVGARNAWQYIGVGDETIKLTGWLAPGQFGTPVAMTLLRDMGNTGKSFVLIDGGGVFHGVFVINSLDEKETLFHKHGKARKIEFDLSLTRVDEDATHPLLGDLELPDFGPLGAALPVFGR